MKPQRTAIDMAEGMVGPSERPPLEPQVYEEPDTTEINRAIAEDLEKKRLKSRVARVEEVVGRASMLDPRFQQRGIDYTVGGALEVRWIKNTQSNLARADANKWVFPESISPRLRNQTHNELVLMVRFMEQRENQNKYLEAEARKYEAADFDKMSGTEGLSEFSVTRPRKQRE